MQLTILQHNQPDRLPDGNRCVIGPMTSPTKKSASPPPSSDSFFEPYHNLVGRSADHRRLIRLLKVLSDHDIIVMILGPTGSGKSHAARVLHYAGRRSDKPLVVVDCSVTPQEEIRAGFSSTPGICCFERSDGGTLILENVDELNCDLQACLLRRLQAMEPSSGQDSRYRIECRLVTTVCSENGRHAAREKLRPDLYFRLKQSQIVLRPLRERQADIPVLIDHFHRLLCKNRNRGIPRICPDAMLRLSEYSWPGNVRELRNILEQAVLCSEGETLTVEDLPSGVVEMSESSAGVHGEDPPVVDETLQALKWSGWNKSKAARKLGISRETLYRRIRKYRLEEPET